MATLESLKLALKEKIQATTSSQQQPLSGIQYSAGFDILMQGLGWTTYQEFIIPQLSKLLGSLFDSRLQISVLDVGPGPKCIFGYLPESLKRKIRKYTAFEPNEVFATRLRKGLTSTFDTEFPLPYLKTPPKIHVNPFLLQDDTKRNTINDEKYDLILFCHSMYGMSPKRKFVEQALKMLVGSQGGMVIIFHRDGALHLDGLVCNRTAVFSTGVVSVPNDDAVLDCFASFVAGCTIPDNVDIHKSIRMDWRETCRSMSRYEDTFPDQLLFDSPEIMVAVTQNATALPELAAQIPLVKGDTLVKSREARLHNPAAILKPTKIEHVQQCVQWALKHDVGLTIVGGGHSGHCLWPNVVSVDMGAFDKVSIIPAEERIKDQSSNYNPVVVAEAGCKSEDIIRSTMAAGLAVPLGARPSVGAGLWLQGGIGHLSRVYGLTCDAVIGAIVVSVKSSDVFCVGYVPSNHRPTGAVFLGNESDLLWIIKGAGTNFGIVISVFFKSFPAPSFLTQNWMVSLSDRLEARRKLHDFDQVVAQKLPNNCSADAYLYSDAGQLQLGIAMFESSTSTLTSVASMPKSTPLNDISEHEHDLKVLDGVGLFEAEMYVSGMHGGHSGGKTSAFKRCMFLNGIGEANVADRLVTAIETRPTPLCYLHLLQGGGAVGKVAADATAFGCRDWEFACVITGVWPRGQDRTEIAKSAVRWVYHVVEDLLPLSCGVYSADLGPDPRDAALATKAFGENLPRLVRLKHKLDPYNLLAYACPLPNTPAKRQRLIFLVTGESGAGKDYCADIWVSVFVNKSLTARAVSISETIKRGYAAATTADLNLLLGDRAYKEQHRPALTAYFQEQARQRPHLLHESFLEVVHGAEDVDVLFITGMRDKAPIATFSHLVPDCRLLEVRVEASENLLRVRRGVYDSGYNNNDNSDSNRSNLLVLDHRPSLIFKNEITGDEAARTFADEDLLLFVHEDLNRLAKMIRRIPNFPRPGIEFCHVLGITQQPGGLALCTSLLQAQFNDVWAKVDAVVCCEAGSFLFASSLALRVDVPLVLIREAGKLPPPTVSVVKSSSYISSVSSNDNGTQEKHIEMEQNMLSRGAKIVVVDDVLSTGETLYAILRLLGEVGIDTDDISIMVVVEFPLHGGRELLRQRGFGKVNIQSLLICGCA
jgi:adenine phosphoribosyltransferase/phosphomevalonate kinase